MFYVLLALLSSIVKTIFSKQKNSIFTLMLLKFKGAIYAYWDSGLEPVVLLDSATVPAGLSNGSTQVINNGGT